MQTFKKEISTIQVQLMGSAWATHPNVIEVLEEYQHLAGAAKTPTQNRRVSLQIFHASRAIDTFLAHVAGNEAAKPGNAAPRPISRSGARSTYSHEFDWGKLIYRQRTGRFAGANPGQKPLFTPSKCFSR